MNKSEQNEERVMQEALRLLEEEESTSAILKLYPTHTADLQTLFDSIEHLKVAQSAKPSVELLRSTLEKISTPIPSSLGRVSFPLWKISVSIFALAVLVIGGTTIIGHRFNSPSNGSGFQTISMNNSSDTSDAALNQDVAAIDSQLGGLSSDETQADQALGN